MCAACVSGVTDGAGLSSSVCSECERANAGLLSYSLLPVPVLCTMRACLGDVGSTVNTPSVPHVQCVRAPVP